MSKSGRHLLDIPTLDDASIEWLLSRAATIRDYAGPGLSNINVVNLFFEASTRTRVSFELAAAALGAHVVNVQAESASVVKGESLVDSALTLTAMGVDILVVRHPDDHAVHGLRDHLPAGVHLVNAGDGRNAHPSQALLDAYTLKLSGLDWPDARIAIIGDLANSRVARSDLALFQRLGAGEIRAAGPETMLGELPGGVRRCDSLEEAVTDADAVIMLRIQKERMARDGWPDSAAYHAEWGLKPEHLERAASGCRVLHPGPMNRGVEIASEVADGPASLILKQVENGVAMRMAVFEWLVHGLGRK